MIDLNKILSDTIKRVDVGNFYTNKQDLDTGIGMFESALDINPKDINALCNGAFVLMKQLKMDRARKWIRQAIHYHPDHPHSYGIAALISQQENEWNLARDMFEHSLSIDPNNVTTLLNYAYLLQIVGDFKKALTIYTKARDLDPLDVNTRFQRAMCILTLANNMEQWREGWGEYELRHALYSSVTIPNKPVYTGQDGGGSLLMIAEQGIGDAVMTARYARWLKNQGIFKKVFVLCLEAWVELLSRISGVDAAASDVSKLPEFDYTVKMMSLMRADDYPKFIPDNSPYLRSDAELTFKPGKLKIGLCWQGNPAHGNDKYRSIGPDAFCDAFAGIEGVEFYSLHQPEVSKIRPDFVMDLSVNTLGHLADKIGQMDLVITVDTAHLHIAGAMGIPVFGLIASNPDFRWQGTGSKTDWYPSATLFRAMEPLKWSGVLAEVRAKVIKFIGDHKHVAV